MRLQGPLDAVRLRRSGPSCQPHPPIAALHNIHCRIGYGHRLHLQAIQSSRFRPLRYAEALGLSVVLALSKKDEPIRVTKCWPSEVYFTCPKATATEVFVHLYFRTNLCLFEVLAELLGKVALRLALRQPWQCDAHRTKTNREVYLSFRNIDVLHTAAETAVALACLPCWFRGWLYPYW